MPDGLASLGAQKDPSRSAAMNMSTYISGLITQQNAFSGGAVSFIQQKYNSATRYDRLIGGANCELSIRLSLVRAPGSSIYNSRTFPRPNRWYSFKPIINGVEDIRVMVDTATNVYDGTGPSRQLNIWNKSNGSGKTQFQGVGDELFFANGIDQNKWVLSQLIWEANTLFDGTATSDTELGDFIIDPNNNIQQAVGGFTLLISNVAITNNVLTLTLDTSQLADPSGTPSGNEVTTGGTLTAGDHFARIAAVDATGNVTEAGSESASAATTGTTSAVAWSWPAVSGAVSYRIYVSDTSGGETTYFTSAVNSFTQTTQVSTVTGVPPTTNSTSVDVPDNLYQMIDVRLLLDGVTGATFLNGHTIRILSVLPGGETSNQVTATFSHADYASAPDTGTASSGNGITGGTTPTWQTTLAAVTTDAGAQWINRGSNVQNWGIATPATAPTIYQSPAVVKYPSWMANTAYWASCCVNAAANNIFLLTTTGVTGSAAPTWDTGAIGNITTDGTAEWTYVGDATWVTATNYVEGAYVGFDAPINSNGFTGNCFYVYKAQNAGLSGASQSTWTFGVGALITDGSIVWECIGKLPSYTENPISPSRSVSSATVIVDSNGYMQTVQDPPNTLSGAAAGVTQPQKVNVSGAAPPTWGATDAFTPETLTATITGFEVSTFTGTNNADITATNNFPNACFVTIAGMTAGSYLNGTVQMKNLNNFSPTFSDGFTIPTLSPAVGFTTDGGTATVLQATMWLNTGAYAPVSTTGYYWAYAYKNSVTKHVGTSSKRSVLVKLRAGFVGNVQGFGSDDPQVDTIVIYRTADGGSTLLEEDEIANPGGGVPFTYNDTVPDTSLDFESLAAINGANNPPPIGFLPCAYHLGRIWGTLNNKLIYSAGPDAIVGSGNEAFPPGNFFFMPETLTRCWPSSIGLIIHGTANVYIQTGLGTPASPFIPPPVFQEGIGLLNYDALTINGSTMYMMTSSNRIISFDPGAGELEVGLPIGDQFGPGTTFDPSSAYLTFHEGTSEDMGLFVGDGSTGWFRMGILAAPENGNVWSPKRNIVGGCGAIQSVEVTPGKKSLLIGATDSGPILQRDYNTYSDNGTAYPMFAVLGSIILCQPGTEAVVDGVTLDSLRIGTRPTVGMLLGELSGYANSPPFITLRRTANDLAKLPAAKTLYSDRYAMKQNQNQSSCRHLQMSINWKAEAVANELLTHTLIGSLRAQP